MKILITILTIAFTFSLNAQDFQGKATYKTHSKMDISFGDDKKNAPNKQMQEELQAQLKKMSQKTFTLNFNKFESTYKENESLSAPQPIMGTKMITLSSGGNSDFLYKNIKENKFAKKSNIMGKVFLIKDDIKRIDWKLSDQTKNIGIYTCYKATYTREVEVRDFSSFSSVGSNDENKEKVNKPKKMKKIVTTAWYTPQIPISNGPREFGGLPGLILELRQGKLTIVCSEVVLNPSEKIQIKQPKKGKQVSQEEFDKILKEKTNEMMERFKSRRGDGNSIQIKIQG